ncbi:hypothetical protein GRJ2_000039300 [Grus japonensis]|uniref:Uncharacterized protein n=1 Tax=Grus japonensis TaxID=30415 RepID=A0ABC9VRT1_GRUJA
MVLQQSDLVGDENPLCSVKVKVTKKREQSSENGRVWEKEGYKQEKYGICVEKEQKKIDYDAVRETHFLAQVFYDGTHMAFETPSEITKTSEIAQGLNFWPEWL